MHRAHIFEFELELELELDLNLNFQPTNERRKEGRKEESNYLYIVP